VCGVCVGWWGGGWGVGGMRTPGPDPCNLSFKLSP
jgi:hypothetical protein